MEEIKAKINDDGSIEIETSGFKGQSCMKELEKLTKSLAVMGINTSVKDQKKKPEYYLAGQDTGIKIKTA